MKKYGVSLLVALLGTVSACSTAKKPEKEKSRDKSAQSAKFARSAKSAKPAGRSEETEKAESPGRRAAARSPAGRKDDKRIAPFTGSIEKMTLANDSYRRALHTGKHSQLVVMSLKPSEEIGKEMHPNIDQFFRIEKGKARFIFGEEDERLVGDGDAVVVPAGTHHNVVNASSKEPLKLYTIYSPPAHPDGTVHKTKAQARAAEHHH
jgi:mannose-6-phosphate isomerase-like protein (cupin superfamily)